ncbi:malate dehydrogenase [Halobellus limi]|uniref:malate dehydrogenase n=1 Tax=Halobellus limi TaxID=699433 RepID=A0A1H6AGF4_9EURY|nr:lactate dehydrogenase [Halobellus limi]QCC47568.1 lactate dehydrogenase [Halobellus limi]SEG47462.1 malate dehydrogenase [Halobellus limi]
MHVAIIGGASTIGSTVAYTLAGLAPTVDVSLVDINEGAAWAHGKDISHASYHFSNAPGASLAGDDVGTVRAATPDELAELAPDLLVFNAAAPQPEDATGRGAREAELDRNLSIVADVAEELRPLDPTPLLVVTNPIDRLVYQFYSLLEWPRRCFLGYSLSESARVADAVGSELGVHPNEVYCPMMGEHGENVVPILSRARAGGEPVAGDDLDREAIREYVLDIPFDIAKERGVNETSRWVTSAGVTRVIRSIAAGSEPDGEDPHGRLGEPFCLSTPLDGEYGFADLALSVPVDLDEGGVAAIHEWDLPDVEADELATAADAVRADLARIGAKGYDG